LEITLSPLFAGVTDRGLRHHRNEDALALLATAEPPVFALIVCDGVSSVTDPDLASAAAAERTRLALEQALAEGKLIGEEEMLAAIAAAQIAVSEIPFTSGSDRERPATTIVMAVIQEERVLIGWLGDSRAYWIDDNGARQLTVDHSWLNDVVASGEMKEEYARKSKHAHAITRWLGADAEAAPSIAHFDIPGPGRLLLCSDGLWNYAPDLQDMSQLLKSLDGDALPVARGLVEFARAKGGNDNITAAVLSFGGDGLEKPNDTV
jgi:serine/threonine protein phosphatase PrpC